MKNQTIKKTRMGRFFGLTVILVLLATLLVSCGGAAAPTLKQDAVTIAADASLNGDQIRAVGSMLSSVYAKEQYTGDAKQTKFNVQDMLIAASRGHDMLANGFVDSQVDPNATGTADPVESALKVIRLANEKATDKNKISEEQFKTLNAADLKTLVDSFKITVDTEMSGGLWDSILRGIGTVLEWITRYLGFGSYIVGICIFAVIVEILMLPFAVKQQKNTIRQAQLRPKEMAIRNKYKGRNDQVTMQKVQQEIQELYQRENFNQFSGCLPLLLQFPILIALYNIVVDPLHYVLGQASGISSAISSYYTAARAAGGLGQVLTSSNGSIELLSGTVKETFAGIQNFQYFTNGDQIWASYNRITEVPDFNIFGLNFGLTPSATTPILLLVPVLTFVVYYFSMRLSRKFSYQPAQNGANDRQVACSNTMMDVSMPLMSTFFAFMMPAIIGVYWIFRSILGTLKQFIMSRVMPLPTFTEEDYKAAAREMAGKAPKKVVKSERAGTVRSLHHIDDEDYEDTRERAQRQKDAMAEKERREQEEKAQKTPFGSALLKDDKRSEKQADATEEKEPETKNDDQAGSDD